MKADPFRLIYTPMMVFPDLDLEAYVGLSSFNPKGISNSMQSHQVWFSVYDPSGNFVDRYQVGKLAPNTREFFPVSSLTEKYGFKSPYLVVVHRVPEMDLTNINHEMFLMFRSIVQYRDRFKAFGSVVYEAPYTFNATKRANFIVHSSQVLLSTEIETYLLLLNFTTNSETSHPITCTVDLHHANGKKVSSLRKTVPGFTGCALKLSELVPSASVSETPSQFTLVGYSNEGILIPLFLNVNNRRGGVSIEHTHPPQAYLQMPNKYFYEIRERAINHFLSHKENRLTQ